MFHSKCCTFPLIYIEPNPVAKSALGEVATTTLTFTFHLFILDLNLCLCIYAFYQWLQKMRIALGKSLHVDEKVSYVLFITVFLTHYSQNKEFSCGIPLLMWLVYHSHLPKVSATQRHNFLKYRM